MSKITVTILGTTAGVPTRERAHSAVHLSYDDGEEFCYLFDCGEGTQRQLILAGLNMMKINDIFITHWHGDHCLGLPGLIDTMGFEGRKSPVKVYSPEERRIRRCLAFRYPMGDFRVMSRNVPGRGKRSVNLLETERFRIVSTPGKHGVPTVSYALEEKDKVNIDPVKAAAFGLPEKGEIYARLKNGEEVASGGRRVKLEDVSVAEKGKRIVYSGDTKICDNLKKLARDAELLIQDCTYFNEPDSEKPHKHASLPEVADLAAKERVKRVILTHISRKYRDADALKGLIKEHPHFEIAKDFMTIVV